MRTRTYWNFWHRNVLKMRRKITHGRERTLRHVLIQLGSSGLNWPGEVRVIELAEGMVLPCGIIASFDECLLGTRNESCFTKKNFENTYCIYYED